MRGASGAHASIGPDDYNIDMETRIADANVRYMKDHLDELEAKYGADTMLFIDAGRVHDGLVEKYKREGFTNMYLPRGMVCTTVAISRKMGDAHFE